MTEHVLVRREGEITRITLNRPQALNALTRDMVIAVREGLQAAAADGSRAALLDGAGERGFCGGGDVKAMAAGGREGSLAFLSQEYRADLATHVSPVPVVGIMDGITMGGGIGLTGHAAVRVVTERSRLAMPETRIGIVPDVGGSRLLAHAPGRLGEMLAIASGSMNGADAIALGFADYFVPSERLQELRLSLSEGEDAAAAAARYAEPAAPSQLLAEREWFDPLAERALGSAEVTLADPVGAVVRLVGELERSPLSQAQALAASVRSVCPTSVVVAVAQLARTRAESLGLAEVLADDYRVLGRLIGRPDFAEGVRAQLIEKDGSPRWSPDALEALDGAEIAAILAPSLEPEEAALSL